MLNLKEFGSRLKLSIKQSPYSQKSICSKLSINKDSLSNYVNGRSLPNTQTLAELCELLNVSSDYLIFGKKSDLFLEKLSSFSTANTDELNNYIDFILYKEKIQNKKQDNQDNIISISKVAEESVLYNKETKDTVAEEAQVYIPMLGFIAAGQPIDLPDDYTFDDVVAMPCTKEAEQADFALQIKGDSMYPLIEDGETILVKKQSSARDGQIVVASINNATTLKKFYQFSDHVELHAINKKYEPIIINNAYTDFRILGVKL